MTNKLLIGNRYVGIRHLHDDVYEPKNLDILHRTLGLQEKGNLHTNTIIACFQNNESTVTSELDDIERRMKGLVWRLVVIDNGSTDTTYAIISNHPTAAVEFFHRQIERVVDSDRLRSICYTYAKSFSSKNDLISYSADNNQMLGGDIVCSFCFVTTERLVNEAIILIYSIRCFHSEPIYIICDDISREIIQSKVDCFNIIFQCSANREQLDDIRSQFCDQLSKLENGLHHLDCIYNKMSAIDFALSRERNTLFLDCDIMFVGKIKELFSKSIVLSPNYWNGSQSAWKKFGIYNAGYIFCSDKSFPKQWRALFLNKSTFCEQQCLDEVVERYDVDVFDHSHNIGFWRGSYNIHPCTSFHCHLFVDTEKTDSLIIKQRLHRAFVLRYLRKSNIGEHKHIYTAIKQLKYSKNQKKLIPIEGKYAQNEWSSNTMPTPRRTNDTGKINLKTQIIIRSHRSGWEYAMSSLAPIHNDTGVLFDGFLENAFSWKYVDTKNNKTIPYTTPWVGFLHNPQNAPPWFFGNNSLQATIGTPEFQESLDSCMGMFALSEYHAAYLRNVTGRTVSVLTHPTEIPELQFNFNSFICNEDKKIVNIGYWLRRMNSIYELPVDTVYTKYRLIPYSTAHPKSIIESLIHRERNIYKIAKTRFFDITRTMDRLSNREYDIMLSKNIVFLDLYDSSANNAIVECIARCTPILVNPIPAVVEYLGTDYPLYFNSLEEAKIKAMDFDLIKTTHNYLKNCVVRKKLTQEYFRDSFVNSEVYTSL